MRISSSLAALLMVFVLMGCSDEQQLTFVVSTSPRVKRLDVTLTLNGMPANEGVIEVAVQENPQNFFVRLAKSSFGSLNIRVNGRDQRNRIIAEGSETIAVRANDVSNEFQIHLSDIYQCSSPDGWCSYARPLITNNLKGIWGSAADNIWAVGEGGIILHWDGASWDRQSSGVMDSLEGLGGLDASHVWAVAGSINPKSGGPSNSGILKWNGSSWNPEPDANSQGLAKSQGFHAVQGVASTTAGVDAKTAWAVGDCGALWQWNGTGWYNWKILVGFGCSDSYRFDSVWGADPNNIWLVGGAGTIMKITNGDGNARSPESNPDMANPQNELFGIWGLDANNVWAVGQNGVILKRTSAWKMESSGTVNGLRGIWGLDAGNIWAVGQSGTIRKWDGAQWTQQDSGTNRLTLHALWGFDIDNLWAVGDAGTILRYLGGP